MVSSFTISSSEATSSSEPFSNLIDPAYITKPGPSTTQEDENPYLLLVREKLIGKNISSNAINVILASWRKGTQSQYKSRLQRWLDFCDKKSINIVSPSIPHILDFLTTLHEKGLSYSSVNTAKCALASVLDLNTEVPLGQLPLIKRFMKGIFELRPSLPKHKEIWDVKLVFDYFRQQDLPAALSLKDLSQKLAFLLCLLSGQRCQTIKYLNIDSMTVTMDRYVFHIKEKVKQTRVGYHIAPLEFIKYPPDSRICVVEHLKEYIKRTMPFRALTSHQLLLSFQKPYAAVSTDTIARWI